MIRTMSENDVYEGGAGPADAELALQRERDDLQDRLDEQLRYYRARAPEYDAWALREGGFERGPRERAKWFALEVHDPKAVRSDQDVAEVVVAVDASEQRWTGECLEDSEFGHDPRGQVSQ